MSMLADYPTIIHTEGLPYIAGDLVPYQPGPYDFDTEAVARVAAEVKAEKLSPRNQRRKFARKDGSRPAPRRHGPKPATGPTEAQARVLAIAERLGTADGKFAPCWAAEEMGCSLDTVYSHIARLKDKGLWRWKGGLKMAAMAKGAKS